MKDTLRDGEWRWLWRELRPYLRPQLLAVTGLLAATLLSLIDPLIIKWLIDFGLQQRNWPSVLTALAVFCVAYLGRMVLLHLGTLTQVRVIQRVSLGIRIRLLRRLQALDATFYDRHSTGDLVHRVEQDVEELSQAAAGFIPTLARIILSVTVTIAIMSVLDWRLTLLVVPFIPLLLHVRARFRSVLGHASDRTREAVAARTSFLTDSLGGALQMQLLGAEHFIRDRYARFAVRATREALSQWRTELYYGTFTLAVMTMATAAVLLAGAHRVIMGALTLGGYIAFYSYLMRLFEPLSSAVEMHARLKRAGGSIRRINYLETRQSVVKDPGGGQRLRADQISHIVMTRASFEYMSGSPILREASLHIARGERVALVGRSGDGKSTLAKLLVRMYDPLEGRVLLGDIDVRDASLRTVRQVVTLVPSKPVLFRGSIRENALLGTRVAARDLEDLAHIACFDTVLDKFPRRWEHVLGADGAGLSDGEQQRLGLLRALVRAAPVLILDEATGALDPDIERDLLSRLEEVTRDRIVLAITHRAGTAAWAERVVLLRAGCLSQTRGPNVWIADNDGSSPVQLSRTDRLHNASALEPRSASSG